MNESSDRDFISRQAGFLHARGEDPTEQLVTVLGADAAPRVNEVLNGAASLPASPILVRVVSTLEEAGVAAARARAAANRIQNDADSLLVHATNVFQGVLTYLTMLAVVMLLVLALFVTAVLPAFETIYQGFGASLPGLTEFVTSTVGHVVLLSAPLVIVLVLWVLLLQGRAILRLQRQPGGWFVLLPVVGAPFRTFRIWLQVMVADVLLEAGESTRSIEEQVRETVGYEPGQRVRPAFECIGMAHRLETQAQEVEYWRLSLENDMLKGFGRARDALSLLVQLVMGAAVAALVVSIYLPLFALGSVL
ncbi:MAG: hypothetical protein AAF458_01975 [Pseudomonadota bacterium]